MFALHEFVGTYHQYPREWTEVFEFLRWMKVKSVYRELAMSMAKASAGAVKDNG